MYIRIVFYSEYTLAVNIYNIQKCSEYIYIHTSEKLTCNQQSMLQKDTISATVCLE